MLTQFLSEQFDRMNGTAYKHRLGRRLSNTLTCVKGTYDFSKLGGAVGSVSLLDDDGMAIKIPTGSLVLNAFIFVPTALTSGGSATIALNIESAGDLLAATAVASYSAAAKLQGIPDFGTLSDAVLTTAERTLQATIATAALLTGKFEAFVFYVIT